MIILKIINNLTKGEMIMNNFPEIQQLAKRISINADKALINIGLSSDIYQCEIEDEVIDLKSRRFARAVLNKIDFNMVKLEKCNPNILQFRICKIDTEDSIPLSAIVIALDTNDIVSCYEFTVKEFRDHVSNMIKQGKDKADLKRISICDLLPEKEFTKCSPKNSTVFLFSMFHEFGNEVEFIKLKEKMSDMEIIDIFFSLNTGYPEPICRRINKYEPLNNRIYMYDIVNCPQDQSKTNNCQHIAPRYMPYGNSYSVVPNEQINAMLTTILNAAQVDPMNQMWDIFYHQFSFALNNARARVRSYPTYNANVSSKSPYEYQCEQNPFYKS